MTADEILRRYWGHKALRPAQLQAIGAILAGRDTLAILPTGGGKSVCYQIPALMKPGVTLVVSPLIALMEDQVKSLHKKGIAAAYINSSLPSPEISLRLEQAAAGKIKLLYITPERIATESFSQAARYIPVSLVAVDEAHCISEWGHDFRPAYRNISHLRTLFPAPVIALTATATVPTATDICRSLAFGADFEMVRETLRRPNLAYGATQSNSGSADLLCLLKNAKGSAIVYCGTRADVLATARMAEENGVSAAQYHAGLDNAIRSRALGQWMRGEKKVMVATSAFGMGIDKADVRLVVHRYIPCSPEEYFQQAGRAGRDGMPCRAVILYDRKSLSTMKRLSESLPEPETVAIIYRRLCTYCSVGPGELPQGKFAFSDEDFHRFCDVENKEIHAALSTLVRCGAIGFFENERNIACAHILATPGECHALSDGPPARALEALARSCDGIFGYSCDLDLEKLASLACLTISDFEKSLDTLSVWGMIEYRPAKKYRSLYFCIPRDDKSLLASLRKTTEAAASRRGERAAKMEEYLRDPGCRARWIEDYFGEKRDDDCSTCDNCLKPDQSYGVEKALEGCRLSTGDIARKTGLPEREVIATLRTLMESGRVEFDGQGKFFLT